jgi:hypothetical protein
MDLRRIERDAVWVCVGLSLAGFIVWPRTIAAGAGVLGGGTLMALSYWAIRGTVDGLLIGPGMGRRGSWALLVKFFTRHAILAVAAYGMMARLRVDPVALLVGVSSFGAAVAAEAIRGVAAGNVRSDS